MTQLLAAGAAGCALFLLVPNQERTLRDRMGIKTANAKSVRPVWILAAGLVLLVGVGHLVLVALVGIGVTWFAATQIAHHRHRRIIRERAESVAEAVESLAAELRCGMDTVTALQRISEEAPFLLPVARAAQFGGDVDVAVQQIEPPVPALRQLSAAWQVADQYGVPIGDVLGGLSEHMAQERESRRLVVAALAPSRATGHILAALPLVGVVMGTSMGHDPLGILLGSWFGAILLAAGMALSCAGVWWVEKLADGAEDGP